VSAATEPQWPQKRERSIATRAPSETSSTSAAEVRRRQVVARSPGADVTFCREDLAGYTKPRRVEFVDALPRNTLGKVLEHEVREKLIEGER
jgi:acyl-CoA synthetase (AMP-forming)/AMP-acid ligase II